MQATATSFKAASLTTLFATPLGNARRLRSFDSRFRSRAPSPRLLITPLIVPVILIAIAVFYVYVKFEARQHADRARRSRTHAGDCRWS